MSHPVPTPRGVTTPHADLRVRKPGLFITGTDTGVGKTVVACAIALTLRRQARARVGVLKPFGTGCRTEREGLVHDDAEALAHFSNCSEPLEIINPIRFKPPLAPAVAAAEAGRGFEIGGIEHSLRHLEAHHDVMVVEGVGGIMVPLDPHDPTCTVLNLAVDLGLPAVVVARSGLGTLNHTVMTVRLLQLAKVPVAGVVMNNYEPDPAMRSDDPSLTSNRLWIEKMTSVPVLACVPRVSPKAADVTHAKLDDAILDAVAMTFWPDVL